MFTDREACQRCNGKGFYRISGNEFNCEDCNGTGYKPPFNWIVGKREPCPDCGENPKKSYEPIYIVLGRFPCRLEKVKSAKDANEKSPT